MQPHFIYSVEEEFRKEVVNLRNYATPGTPRFKVARPNNTDKIDSVMKSNYRSGIGMILKLIQHSRPDVAKL
jgi:hypothetical protein